MTQKRGGRGPGSDDRSAPGVRAGTRLLELAENVSTRRIATFLVAIAVLLLVPAGRTRWDLFGELSQVPVLELLDRPAAGLHRRRTALRRPHHGGEARTGAVGTPGFGDRMAEPDGAGATAWAATTG
jgi:hypothetical protein